MYTEVPSRAGGPVHELGPSRTQRQLVRRKTDDMLAWAGLVFASLSALWIMMRLFAERFDKASQTDLNRCQESIHGVECTMLA